MSTNSFVAANRMVRLHHVRLIRGIIDVDLLALLTNSSLCVLYYYKVILPPYEVQ